MVMKKRERKGVESDKLSRVTGISSDSDLKRSGWDLNNYSFL
jgi:hypothetical protein